MTPYYAEEASMTEPRYFRDTDGNGDDTVWLNTGATLGPTAVLRERDVLPAARHLWPEIVAALTAQQGEL